MPRLFLWLRSMSGTPRLILVQAVRVASRSLLSTWGWRGSLRTRRQSGRCALSASVRTAWSLRCRRERPRRRHKAPERTGPKQDLGVAYGKKKATIHATGKGYYEMTVDDGEVVKVGPIALTLGAYDDDTMTCVLDNIRAMDASHRVMRYGLAIGVRLPPLTWNTRHWCPISATCPWLMRFRTGTGRGAPRRCTDSNRCCALLRSPTPWGRRLGCPKPPDARLPTLV